jgi:hypothetical protein
MFQVCDTCQISSVQLSVKAVSFVSRVVHTGDTGHTGPLRFLLEAQSECRRLAETSLADDSERHTARAR